MLLQEIDTEWTLSRWVTKSLFEEYIGNISLIWACLNMIADKNKAKHNWYYQYI